MNDTIDTKTNALTILHELHWLEHVIAKRIEIHQTNTGTVESIYRINPPDLSEDYSLYSEIVKHYQLTFAERLILLLSIIPHIKPEVLNPFMGSGEKGKIPVEFGGIIGNAHAGFIPTGQTALFILAGNLLDFRLELMKVFSKDHFFHKFNILKLRHLNEDEPFLSGLIKISDEYFDPLVKGIPYQPILSEKFPASKINSNLEWNDLVLPHNTMVQVEQIRTWIQHKKVLMEDWGLKKNVKPGFRSLFYGPPGTGKTLTATLLGKITGMEVYRVDLAMTVSKWIGETEKNLMNLFEQAENKNWILFFDEADSLFNKRTQVSSSNDRNSNQQVAYLLQKIEDFPGVVLMASNMKQNIDEAFTRRIQSMIYFPMPGPDERLTLWEDHFVNKNYQLEPEINLKEIASKYELAGGSIINVLRYACTKSIGKGSNKISKLDLIEGIRGEFLKEGKVIS